VRVDTESQALVALEALQEGGIAVAEIALSTPGSIAFLSAAIGRFGSSMIIGAGTVLDPETARTSILTGAQFIVSPSLNAGTIQMCRRYSTVVIPGALTPTEILRRGPTAPTASRSSLPAPWAVHRTFEQSKLLFPRLN
jgi:2-dehydro-3-deoxyphosphogluconate aldolase / (4S)-4-hydroxy-2-oxoglutarate aldolase